MPALTIGMAVFNDFNGVYFTVQALRMYHNLSDVELIVVDNQPNSPEGRAVRTLMENYADTWTAGSKYIPYTEKSGTSAPRQKIFEEASGDAVLCLDSHVLLSAGAIERLLQYYAAYPEDQNLLSGPMMYDNLKSFETSFEDQWRAEMWGIWGHNALGAPPKEIPPYAWYLSDNTPPFEIPAMGLGLFSCRKSAWLGFNPHFSGFGGEEFYIHNKFRQAGRKCLSLPFLRWLHRFPRPNGIQYPLTRWQKIRNYVIGHQELGLPIDRVYEHFVKAALISETEWAYLLDDPIGHTTPPGTPPSGCTGCPPVPSQNTPPSSLPQPPDGLDINQMYESIRAIPRGFELHMPKLRELATKSERVCEFSQHRESTLALLAGSPKVLISWQKENDALLARLHQELGKIDSTIRKTVRFTTGGGSSLAVDIPDCDLLFLDTIYTADNLLAELLKHGEKVSKYIAIYATQKYGEVGAQNGPGLLPGLREFLKRFPSWRVVYHTDEQDGLTVISRAAEDAQPLPSTPQMVFNYAAFLTKHLVSGGGMVAQEVARLRLDTCATCPFRTAHHKNPDLARCSKCGCFLLETYDGRPGKALFQMSQCPLGFWQTAEAAGHPIIPISPKENPAA